MDNQRIYSAEQIQIPPDLSKILREYTKAVIRANPSDLNEFSLCYFEEKVKEDLKRKE
jgi:hypothetical protein